MKFKCWMIWPLLFLGPMVLLGWMALATKLSDLAAPWGKLAEIWVGMTWIMLPFAVWMWLICTNNRPRS